MPKQSNEDLTIDALGIKRAAALVRAVDHPLRQKMLRVITLEGPIAVQPLYQKLNLVQSVTSQHLAVLRQACIVMGKREGKQVLYSVQAERIRALALAVALLAGK